MMQKAGSCNQGKNEIISLTGTLNPSKNGSDLLKVSGFICGGGILRLFRQSDSAGNRSITGKILRMSGGYCHCL